MSRPYVVDSVVHFTEIDLGAIIGDLLGHWCHMFLVDPLTESADLRI